MQNTTTVDFYWWEYILKLFKSAYNVSSQVYSGSQPASTDHPAPVIEYEEVEIMFLWHIS